MNPKKFEEIIRDLANWLPEMTEDQRLQIFNGLGDYCRYCGRAEYGTTCQCWNDE